MKDDLTLLQSYATDGSNEAFAELVARHIDFVYATALRYAGSAYRAEEVTQSVFTDLARKARSLLGRRELVGWLYISTHYAAVAVVRSEVRRKTREQEAHMLQVLSSDSNAVIDWAKLYPLLDSALRDLNDTDRSAILLRYFKRHTFAEVGKALSMTEDAARKRVDRALDKLHPLLAKRGITSSAAALSAVLTQQPIVAAPLVWASGVSSVALVGAAAGGVGAITLGAFFASAKGLSATAATIALVALGAVAYQQMHSPAAAPESATARRDIAPKSQPSLDSPVTDNTRNQKTDAPLRVNRVPRSTGLARSSNDADAPMARSPDAEARLARARDSILRRYGPLYEQLKFDARQKDRLTQLLIDYREASTDFAAASARSGEDVSRDQELFADSVSTLRDGIMAQINELLGDDNYATFLTAHETLQQASVVEVLQKRLSRTQNGLSSDQAEQLQHAMADLQVHKINDAVIERAAGFLSPAQVTALRDLRERRKQGVQRPNIQQAVQENLPKASAKP